jgi:hypothetical protein
MTPDPDTAAGNKQLLALYRSVSIVMAVVFAIVGLLFLVFSRDVLVMFNQISVALGVSPGPEQTSGFYVALGVSYMYLVSLISFLMWLRPQEQMLPLLLINGKAASSLLSATMFVADRPLLIYVANAIVDGAIAVGVYMLYRNSAGRST